MKVLFVIPSLLHGGAERVVSVISTALSNCEIDTVVVKYFEDDGEYPIGERVRVVNLSGGGVDAYNKMAKPNAVRALRKVLKDEKPDFTIPFMYPSAQLTDFAASGLPTAVLQSIRINPQVGPPQKWKRILRDRLVYRSKCTFVQNEQQKQYFKKKYHHKIHVLYNPVSEELFSAAPKSANDRFVICSLGRLSDQKNFPLLIDAFAEAFGENDPASLQIYGEGAKRAELEAYIAEKGLEQRVMLMGRTDHVKETFEQSDLFVLSSDWEGMPNALIEAMACHVPCISTDCPTGPADLIENGANGILVPVRDRTAMANAMRSVFEMSAAERLQMGEKARETVREKCSSDQIAKKMISILKSVQK